MSSNRSAKIVFALCLTAFSVFGLGSRAFAYVSCSKVVAAVQTENDGRVLVKFADDTWHVIAEAASPARSDRLSVATAALLSGKELYLRYTPNTYSCTATNYIDAPTIVRVYQ